MLLVHCLASRVCQKLTFNTFPVVPELSAVMCPRGFGLGRGFSLKAKTKAKDLGPKAKAKDFVIKAKAKATALCPRGASRTRTSPREHITDNISKSYKHIVMIFSTKSAYVLGTNLLDIGGNPASFVLPGSFSRILYHYEFGHKLAFCSVRQQVTNEF